MPYSNGDKSKFRIAVLWSQLSGYFSACLRALVEIHNVELMVFRISSGKETLRPYQDSLFDWLPKLYTLTNSSTRQLPIVSEKLANFNPNVLLVSGWSIPVYRHISKQLKKQGVHTIAGCDNQWSGSMKQWLGILSSRLWLHSMFDALWVPGERGATFARKLGFSGNKLLLGIYSCNTEAFQTVAKWRFLETSETVSWPPRFMFIGRMVQQKGMVDLIEAYGQYRTMVQNPWELHCAGTGPLESLVTQTEGATHLGFLQPDACVKALKKSSVFVLPSHYEPWGVVIHEATSAGLPILCTHQCGSSVELVQDGYNGFLFDAGDVKSLVRLMIRISNEKFSLTEMGKRSVAISARYSPQQWANNFISHIEMFH